MLLCSMESLFNHIDTILSKTNSIVVFISINI